jgi:hypothetical protein
MILLYRHMKHYGLQLKRKSERKVNSRHTFILTLETDNHSILEKGQETAFFLILTTKQKQKKSATFVKLFKAETNHKSTF